MEAVQASAECVGCELGLYHTEEVYRKAMRIELGAQPASVVLRYRGEIVGTQHIDLMLRGHAVEVRAQSMARGWEGWDVHEQCTRKARASGCKVILVVFSPIGVHVKQFDAENAVSETVAFHYDGQRVGTQLLRLVWRRYIVEVECLAAQSADHAVTHHDTCFMRARTCRRDVLLVKFPPSGVRVALYAAPDTEPKPKVTVV